MPIKKRPPESGETVPAGFARYEIPIHDNSVLETVFISVSAGCEYSFLKPMTMSLFMLIARQYRLNKKVDAPKSISARIVQYMNACPESVTLKEVAGHFSYHPNYVSALLRKEFGKTFSEIMLEKRMSKAVILLERTSLSIEEISVMLGYSNTSNFHKAFREYYRISPREYVKRIANP